MAQNMEAIVIQWLADNPKLKGYPVYAAMPADNPERVITVEQTGGRIGYTINTYMMCIYIYAASRYEASQTALQTVIPRLLDLWKLPGIASATIENIAHYPFPGPPVRHRYMVTCHITAAAQ